MPRPSLADASARQPELQGARTASGNPPFIRRCLMPALQLRGLTYRELFAYAVLVSHCRAFVDGDHGICTLLYSTWATEAGVFRPRPGEDADASSRRMESARREMRAIAKRLKEAGLLLVRMKGGRVRRASELLVFPPQMGVKHPSLDRGETPLSTERGSKKGSGTSTAAATNEGGQGKQQQRLDGLIAYIATRYRELSRKRRPAPSPWPEDLVRADFAAGIVGIGDLQDLADALRGGCIPGEVVVRAADLQLDSGDGGEGCGRANGEPCDNREEDDMTEDDTTCRRCLGTTVRVDGRPCEICADLEDRVVEFARCMSDDGRDAVLAAKEFFVIVDGDARAVADLPEPRVQVGVDSAGRVVWVSVPLLEAAA